MSPPTFAFHDLVASYHAQREALDAAIRRVMESGYYILGSEGRAFESEFAAYLGVDQVVGTGSATEALQVGLLALGVGHGDDVLVPSLTAAATAMAVIAVGARAVFVDIDPDTFTMDPRALERSIGPKAKVVIPVHLYGQSADMDAIGAVAAKHGLTVFEDASQSHGARFQGRMTGSIGRLACFSFYPTKNLGAFGDGGALATRDARLADELRRLRNYGFIEGYDCSKPGINARLDEIHAAMLRVKLTVLDAGNARRRATAARYLAEIRNPAVRLPIERPGDFHVRHQFVVRSARREALRDHLRKSGVETLIHYPRALHRMSGLGDRASYVEEPKEAARAAAEVLSLPIYPEVPPEVVDATIAAVCSFER